MMITKMKTAPLIGCQFSSRLQLVIFLKMYIFTVDSSSLICKRRGLNKRGGWKNHPTRK